MSEAMDVDVDLPVKKEPKESKVDGGKPRFEVKKWNAVSLWAWDIVVENCAICRNHIMDLCALPCLFFRVSYPEDFLKNRQALNVKPIRYLQPARNVPLRGESAITPSTSIAYPVG
ncbi:hypothetical protein D9757_011543 [Collybiopsis confluens]|uniref:Uncharacterized protein n=1 Tax=Collybiopsis confluens TaxID=2823264 RepID=A0A8H5GAV6_9AGAR|nr:hypothetical protein D9757_011543 [Collybiopsis confluens]